MLKPRALAPGDRLAIVSPASPFRREEFDEGLEELHGRGELRAAVVVERRLAKNVVH